MEHAPALLLGWAEIKAQGVCLPDQRLINKCSFYEGENIGPLPGASSDQRAGKRRRYRTLLSPSD